MRETRTNTPLQALNLMNDVTFVEAARKLAERMMKEGGKAPRERIAFACELVLARPPKPAEMHVVLDTLAEFETRYHDDTQGRGGIFSLTAIRRGNPQARLAGTGGLHERRQPDPESG